MWSCASATLRTVGVTTIDIDQELRSRFGFAEFRAGQREAVEAVLEGRDVLAIMPTGSGKSLCYQLPAVVGAGLTVVVSPLIALMQDQHAALVARGFDGIEMLASSMSREDVTATLERIGEGGTRLVYVAPERFSSRRFLDKLAATNVSRLAVDEAHCLSEWGHDFRPDYRRLADVRERLGSPPTIALTATATPRVAKDIVAALGLRDPATPTTGFDRANLFFEVIRVAGDAGKTKVLAALLREPDRLPAVVYCGRRKTCVEVADRLRAAGVRAEPYHAGLSQDARSQTLRRVLGRGSGSGRGDHSVRHGHRQGRCALGGALDAAGIAGGVLPAGGPRGARRPPGSLHTPVQPRRQGV